MASEEPTVLVPMAFMLSSWAGTLKRRAIMETQRFWMSVACVRKIRFGIQSGKGVYRRRRDIPDGEPLASRFMARIAFAYLVINKVLGEAFDHELLSFFFLCNLSDIGVPSIQPSESYHVRCHERRQAVDDV